MLGRRAVRVGVVIAVAMASGVLVWLAVRGEGSTTANGRADTLEVSAQGLRAIGAALGRPVYWAGPRRGDTYEFTETPALLTYVRYLPPGMAVGSPKGFLTIGTYPVVNAFAVTSRVARRPGGVRLAIGGGGVAFYSKTRPTNIYLAFPGANVQVEVYDPSAVDGQNLVRAGGIRAITAQPTVSSASQSPSVSTTRAALEKIQTALRRPIYWLGPLSGSTVEFTRTAGERVYVRYLPPGVPADSRGRYLTVATYPIPDGLAVTSAASRRPGSVRIRLPGGGIAFFSNRRPTNVYVAFPGVPEQIEVFDPSARDLRRLVAADRVQPVS